MIRELIPLTEEMLPYSPEEGLDVAVDGQPARCWKSFRGWGSEKIVILFDEGHHRWSDGFTTKYYEFREPGKMHWGFDGGVMEIFVIPSEGTEEE